MDEQLAETKQFYEKQLEAAEQEKASLENQLRDARKYGEADNPGDREQESRIHVLMEENANLCSRLAKVEEEQETLQTNLSTTIKDLKAKLEEMSKELSCKDEALASLNSQYEFLLEEKERLKKEMKHSADTLSKHASNEEHVCQMCSDQSAVVANLTAKVEVQEKDVAKAIAEKQEAQDAFNLKLQSATQQQQLAESIVENLRVQLTLAEAQYHELLIACKQEQTIESAFMVADLQAQLRTTRANLEEAERSVQSFEQENLSHTDLSSELQAARADKTTLEFQLTKAVNSKNELNVQIDYLKVQLSDADQLLQDANTKVRAFETEIVQKKTQHDNMVKTLVTQIEEEKKSCGGLREMAEHLAVQLKKEEQAYTSQIEALSADILQKDDMITKLETQLEKRSSEFNEMQLALKAEANEGQMAAASQLHSLDEQLQAETRQKQEAEQNLQKQQDLLQNLALQHKETEQRVKVLEELLEDEKFQHKNLEEKLSTVTMQAENKQVKYKELEAQVQELEDKLCKAENTLAVQTEKLKELLQAEVEKLKEESDLKEFYEKERDRLKEACDEADADIAEVGFIATDKVSSFLERKKSQNVCQFNLLLQTQTCTSS